MRLLTDIEVRNKFGNFDYKSNPQNGSITILGDWVKDNIVRVQMPIVGFVRCHKEISVHLFKIFAEIESEGYAACIDISDTRLVGGSFVPRHKCWNPRRGLSRHSWGIAYDINPSTNKYGAKPTLHAGIIKIFKANGFYWGGDFRVQDGMHFEVSDEFKKLEPVTFPEKTRKP